jgi:hypothetical protein
VKNFVKDVHLHFLRFNPRIFVKVIEVEAVGRLFAGKRTSVGGRLPNELLDESDEHDERLDGLPLARALLQVATVDHLKNKQKPFFQF